MISLNPPSLILAVLIWTILATVVWLFIRSASQVNPLLRYHLATATLIGLPLGLFLSLFMSVPAWMFASSGPIQLMQSTLPSAMLNEIVIGAGAEAAGNEAGSAATMSVSAGSIVIYSLIALMMLGLPRLLFLYVSLKKQLRRVKTVENNEMNEVFHAVKKNLALSDRVQLLSMNEAKIPFTAGFRNPVIVLPAKAIEECTSEEAELIIMHESIHINRMDYVLHSIELFIRHLFWMHPVVHLLYRQATILREMACDEEVMRNRADKADEYARILCQFALKPGSAPVFKAAMAQEHHLLTRIRQLSTLQTPNERKVTTMKKSITLAAMMLLIIAGAMACSDLTQNPDTEVTELTLDDEIELRGQTYTIRQFRDMVAETRDAINKAIDETTDEAQKAAMRESRDMFANVVMLIDNGQAGRAVSLYRDFMPSEGDMVAEDNGEDVFLVVEEMPQIVGGQMALYEALSYPELAKRGGIEGRVIMQFIVNEDGSVSDINVVRSAGAGGLDDAAVEAMSQMEFTPGIQRGRAVKVQMTQPVIFRLNSDSAN